MLSPIVPRLRTKTDYRPGLLPYLVEWSCRIVRAVSGFPFTFSNFEQINSAALSHSFIRVLLFFMLLVSTGTMGQTQSALLDSLLRDYQRASEPEIKSKLATDIAWEYLYSEPEKTLQYAEAGLRYGKEAGYTFGMATAHGTYGLYYDVTGDYDQAIQHYLKAITLLETLENVEVNLASNYSNLALIFDYIKDHQKAIYYSKKALQLEKASGQKVGEIYSYINLAAMYRSAGDIDSSLYYHARAIATGQASGNEEYKVTYVNIGNIYLDRGNLDSAQYYYTRFLKYARALGARQYNRLAYAFSGLASLYLSRNQLETGKAYADSALRLTRIMQFRDLRKDVYQHYVTYYRKKENFRQAFLYLEKVSSLEDSLGNSSLKEQIETLEARFQNEQNRNQITALEAQNKIQELTLEKANTQKQFFLAIAILALVVLGVMIAFWRIARSTSRQLATKNALIENLIRESHHRIKNNLQVVSSLLHMQGHTLHSKEAQKAIGDAHTRVKTIALLHQRLQGSADFECIYIRAFLKELSHSITESLQTEELSVDLHLGVEDLRLPTDRAIVLGLLVNEFLTNSLKYAVRPGQELKIGISLNLTTTLNFTYRDNGPGLPGDNDLQTKVSLGFTIINSLISQLNGTLVIQEPPGFSAEIHFPYVHR